MKEFKICQVGESGAVKLSPICISPEVAAKRDPIAFLAFYEECRRVAEKYILSEAEGYQDSKQLPLLPPY